MASIQGFPYNYVPVDGITSTKAFIGVTLVIVVFAIIVSLLKGLTKKKKKPKTKEDEQGTKPVVGLRGVVKDMVIETTGEEETKVDKQTVELFIDNLLKEKPIRFSSQELVNLTCNYSTKLGSGGFGEVYKGEFPNGVEVAVKLLKSNIVDKRLEQQFMAEIGTIGRTYHKNLVRLIGFCFDSETKALVYEFMENGSLDKLLFRNKHELEWGKLYEIAIGAAKGLEYLHHYSHKRIIHYDIKPGNVLLNSEYCPKLGDFGLARLCNRDSTHVTLSGGRGTPGYAAPELWMAFPVTYKCDVYSFGIMLFEIIGRRRNINDIDVSRESSSHEWFPTRLWGKVEKGELEIELSENGIEEKDMVKAKTMTMVALWCVQYLPETRPSMSNVVKILEDEVQVTVPLNPFQHLISPMNSPLWTGSSSCSTTDDGIIDKEKDGTLTTKKYE